MNEEEAREWLRAHFDVPRETWARLDGYVMLLLAEAEQQNLISEATKAQMWSRHIVDCAQLIPLAGARSPGEWIDLGAGAGLPGMVVAILSDWPVLMVESRRLRVGFLQHVIDSLDLTAKVHLGRIETLQAIRPAAVISARAYAPLPRLFASSVHLASQETIWLLPKGRNWQNELETARKAWQAAFHVEQSITDPESAVVVARGLRKKGRR